jgi:hypothetical protein
MAESGGPGPGSPGVGLCVPTLQAPGGASIPCTKTRHRWHGPVLGTAAPIDAERANPAGPAPALLRDHVLQPAHLGRCGGDGFEVVVVGALPGEPQHGTASLGRRVDVGSVANPPLPPT